MGSLKSQKSQNSGIIKDIVLLALLIVELFLIQYS